MKSIKFSQPFIQSVGRRHPDPLKVIINVPGWFKVGMKFKSKWISDFENECTVISFDKDNNVAEIHVKTYHTQFTEDNWNLQHTLWGFENGDYIQIIEKP